MLCVCVSWVCVSWVCVSWVCVSWVCVLCVCEKEKWRFLVRSFKHSFLFFFRYYIRWLQKGALCRIGIFCYPQESMIALKGAHSPWHFSILATAVPNTNEVAIRSSIWIEAVGAARSHFYLFFAIFDFFPTATIDFTITYGRLGKWDWFTPDQHFAWIESKWSYIIETLNNEESWSLFT